MKVEKIDVHNYRLLRDFSISIEDDLSLIIGKNNVGKTSFLSALDKFLNKSESITFDDFNVELKEKLKLILTSDLPTFDAYEPASVAVTIYIKYDDVDKCDRIEPLLTTLDPANKYVVLQFSYELDYAKLSELHHEYRVILGIDGKNQALTKAKQDPYLFLRTNQQHFFRLKRRSLRYDIATEQTSTLKSVDIDAEKISISDIIKFTYISAKREVTNRDIDKTLSTQIAKLYKKSNTTKAQTLAVETFRDHLIETDLSLSAIYEELFDDILAKIKSFGGVGPLDSALKILSSLQHRELLEGNTTVTYNHSGHSLPESYNGLGYMNLLSIIFEIEIIVRELRRTATERPADINLLLIEEPEAHTHPQLQYVFIKNIKELLRTSKVREDGLPVQLQSIISTHSAHIVSESEFDDIKYFIKDTPNSVSVRNLRDLHKAYSSAGEEHSYRFLKQYLTLSRAELFFADKAILIEGDTERIILPTMMKRLDAGIADNPLCSQNISIVEVGAHSHVFEKFVDFLSIRSLILTDIDSYYIKDVIVNGVPKLKADGTVETETIHCASSDPLATESSNYALRFFFNTLSITNLRNKPIAEKSFRKTNGAWSPDPAGNLCVAFQIEEDGYGARSFEDAFFHINSSFIKCPGNIFESLTPKWLNKYKAGMISELELAEMGIKSKPSLAIEILMNSIPTASDAPGRVTDWAIPSYIAHGLEWLRKEN